MAECARIIQGEMLLSEHHVLSKLETDFLVSPFNGLDWSLASFYNV